MKRSEFNLLVENWRKFLKGDVIQEQTEDFDYYADEIEKQPEVGNAQDDFDVYAGVDDQADSDVEATNKDPEYDSRDILQVGKEALLFYGQDLDEKREELKLKEIGKWFTPWDDGYALVMIEDYKEGLGYVVSEMGRPDNKLENVPSEYLTHDLDYEDKNTEVRRQADADRDWMQGGEQDFAANNP